ncbi:hypothetical protein GCM10010220_37120 [Streptomyces parvulus]|nr:hypothetical protein GCM10010220_37120 [Streptomyces parvulus]
MWPGPQGRGDGAGRRGAGNGKAAARPGEGGRERPPFRGIPLPDSRGGTPRLPDSAPDMRARGELSARPRPEAAGLPEGYCVQPWTPEAVVTHASASAGDFTATIGV